MQNWFKESWRTVKIGKQVGSARKLVLAAGVSTIAMAASSPALADCTVPGPADITISGTVINNPISSTGSNYDVVFAAGSQFFVEIPPVPGVTFNAGHDNGSVTIYAGGKIGSDTDGEEGVYALNSTGHTITLNGPTSATRIEVGLYGSWDSIYFRRTDSGAISDNCVNVLGESFVYAAVGSGIRFAGNNSNTIENNTILVNGNISVGDANIDFSTAGIIQNNNVYLDGGQLSGSCFSGCANTRGIRLVGDQVLGNTIIVNNGSIINTTREGLFVSGTTVVSNYFYFEGDLDSTSASFAQISSTAGYLSGNTIKFNGGTVNAAQMGLDMSSTSGGINSNEISIVSGTTFASTQDAIRLYSSTGQISGNTINLNGSVTALSGSVIYAKSQNAIDGNSINILGGYAVAGSGDGIFLSGSNGVTNNNIYLGGGSDLSAPSSWGMDLVATSGTVGGNTITLNDASISNNNYGVRFRSINQANDNSISLSNGSSIQSGTHAIQFWSNGTASGNTISVTNSSLVASSHTVQFTNVASDNSILLDGGSISTVSGAANAINFITSGTDSGNSITLSNGSQISTNGVGNGINLSLNGTHYISIYDTSSVTSLSGIGIQASGSGVSYVTVGGSVSGGSGVAVNLDGGDDFMTLLAGHSFTGTVEGGSGMDTLVFEGAGTESGTFNSFEAIAKTGLGDWVSTQAFNVNSVTVSEGNLFIDGSMTSGLFTVAAGAGLGGAGSINGDVDVSGQIIAASNDVMITGNIAFNSGSALLVGEVGGSSSHQLVVSGTASIDPGSNVAISGSPGIDFYSVVLTSGGVTGVFDSVTDAMGMDLANYAVSTQNGTDIVVASLPVSQVSAQAASTTGDNSFREFMGSILTRMDVAFKHPEGDSSSSTAFAFNPIRGRSLSRGSNSLTNMLMSKSLTPTPSVESFTSMMLERSYEEMSFVGSDVVLHTEEADRSRAPAVWVRGFAGMASQDATSTLVGYESHGGGIGLGRDAYLSNNWLGGFAAGYARSNAELDGDAGEVDLDSFYGALYGSYENDGLHINLIAAGGSNDYEASRKVTNGSSIGVASGKFDGQVWSIRVEAAHDYDVSSNAKLRPRVSIEHIRSKQDDYIDDGGNIITGLEVDSHTTKAMRYEGQVDWINRSLNSRDLPIEFSLRAGIAYEDYSDDREVLAGFIGSNNPIALTLSEDSRTLGLVGGALNTKLSDTLSMQVGYNGELSGDYQLHSIFAGLRLDW
ncbi:MAG: autotransporter outer membrane beta-barrel domain-containing protein [Alphaproteobacteria bacterium]|nr:MAG: autotransporter outer membrane beta-barrel domain-containing protein [Alphaproteobacteria bacterium]